MKQYEYVIVGGGIAGTAAAEMIRRYDTEKTLAIISDEPFPLYSRISLSKKQFLLGEKNEKDLFIKSQKWYRENKINTCFDTCVESLNTQNRRIGLTGGTNISYTKLLLALGGQPIKHSADNDRRNGIHYLRTLRDAKRIIRTLHTAKKTVVIGSGFISFELCDILRNKGIDVSVSYVTDRYWGHILDDVASGIVEKNLKKNDVRLYPGLTVESVERTNNDISGVTLSNGTILNADSVMCGIGIHTQHNFLDESGITIHSGIVVDEFLKTSDTHIWASGDVAEFFDPVLNYTHQLGNWVNALMQGRTVGYNMTHEEPKRFSYISPYTSSGNGLTVSFVGDVRKLPRRNIIERGPLETTYAQLIVEDSTLVGAVLINRGHEIIPISRMITERFDTSSIRNSLADPSINLKTLI